MTDKNQAKKANIRREISLKLTITARQMHKQFDSCVSQTGMTRSQWTLIAAVASRPGASQRNIAEMLEMSEASAGRLIDRLCSDGLLERRPHEFDQRAWCVFVTDAAQPLLKKMALLADDLELAAFAGLSNSELVQLLNSLDAINRNLGLKPDE